MSAPEHQSENFLDVVRSLQETPNAIIKLVSDLTEDEQRFKESDEFSILETICHLRDLEVEGYGSRIERILRETDPQLQDFDGARAAVERDYNAQNLQVAFRAFDSARQANVQRLSRATEIELEREGTLEGVGKINLQILPRMMMQHDEGHLHDLKILRQRIFRLRTT